MFFGKQPLFSIVVTYLFTNLLWLETAKLPFDLRIKLPLAHHKMWRLHTFSCHAKRHARKLRLPIFIAFGLTQPGIKPEVTVSEADALSTRPPISYDHWG